MTGQHRIVVLGAGYAGLAAARRLAKKARDAQITVVDTRAEFVERVRLHQQAAGQQIPAWDLRELLERRKIQFVQARATEINTAGKRILLDSAPELGYDSLVDGDGRIRTDATLRSVSHSDVYAAGDAAVIAGPDGRDLRMACATALPTGKYAADVVAARARGREPRELRFWYAIQCVSLGRRDGVIQALHADDSPGRTVLTGRTAAWVKERVVRGAGWAARP